MEKHPLRKSRMTKFDYLSAFQERYVRLNALFETCDRDFIDLVCHMLEPIPWLRITARQCLFHPFFAKLVPFTNVLRNIEYNSEGFELGEPMKKSFNLEIDKHLKIINMLANSRVY